MMDKLIRTPGIVIGHASGRPSQDTCRHNVIRGELDKNLELSVDCLSCGKDLSALEDRVGKNYQYDIDYDVWVHVPKSRGEGPVQPTAMRGYRSKGGVLDEASEVDDDKHI